MYYELYIDVFFAVNFMMDYILLIIVRKMLKCPVPYGRICLGAAAGAGLTCLTVMLPTAYTFIKFVMFHVIINVVMIKTGLKVKGAGALLRAWILLYISGFLVGGVFEFLHQYVRIGSLFFVLAVVSYYAVSGIWSLIAYLARQNQYRCRAVLYMGGNQCEVDALIDTGNSLTDEITGKPVSIIDRTTAAMLRGCEEKEGIRYIPYHTIGRKEGLMEVIRLDGMEVCGRKKQWIEAPLAAVCEDEISTDDYKMILNPDILAGGMDK